MQPDDNWTSAKRPASASISSTPDVKRVKHDHISHDKSSMHMSKKKSHPHIGSNAGLALPTPGKGASGASGGTSVQISEALQFPLNNTGSKTRLKQEPESPGKTSACP